MIHKLYVHPFLFQAEEQVNIAIRFKVGLEFSLILKPKLFDEELKRIQKRIETANLNVSVHLPAREILLGAFDTEIRKISLRRILDSLEIAKKLNAEWAVLHLNFIDLFYCHVENKWLRYLVESLEAITNIGIPIYLENTKEQTPEIFQRILKLFEDRIFMCLDIGHAFGYSDIPLTKWIEELCPWIKEVHLCETEKGKDLHIPLGSGFIDLENILDHLENTVGNFVITLEPINLKQLENDIKWLKERHYV